MKINRHLYKTYYKNQFLLFRKTLSDVSFVLALNKLSKKWHRKAFHIKTPPSLSAFLHYIQYDQILKKMTQEKKDFTEDYLTDIRKLLLAYDLGDEWVKTIYFVMGVGELVPPQLNFNLITKGDNKQKMRVVLELNPDTSLEDIEAAWPQIKKEQRELWPNFKHFNLTRKTKEHLELYLQDTKEKSSESEVESATDLDIVSRIWKDDELTISSAKLDKKRRAKLRQNRHRTRKMV